VWDLVLGIDQWGIGVGLSKG